MDVYIRTMVPLLAALSVCLRLAMVLGGEECTSWVIGGDRTMDGYHKTILHKNRDKERNKQVVVRTPRQPYESNSRDPEVDSHLYSYLAIVSRGDSGMVAAGINEHGLAVANNYVAGIFVPSIWAYGTLTLNRLVLEYCKTVEEAYLFIEQICADNMILNGGALFLADPDEAAIIEHLGKNHTDREQSIFLDGARARSNDFIVLQGGLGGGDDVRLRYEYASEFLDDREGELHEADCFELSRLHHVLPDGKASLNDGSICNYPKDGQGSGSTLFGATFVIDRENPALSTMWVALGTPDTAIYTPVHLTSLSWNGSGPIGSFVENDVDRVVHPAWTTAEIYDLAEAIRQSNLEQYENENDLGMGRLTPCFTEIESQLIAKSEQAEEEARNDPARAEEILSSFDIETADSILAQMIALAAGEVDAVCNADLNADAGADEDPNGDSDPHPERDSGADTEYQTANDCACSTTGRFRISLLDALVMLV